jgi:carboxyl-terminal processing protease
MSTSTHTLPSTRRIITCALLPLVLSACGGGGDKGNSNNAFAPTGASSTYAQQCSPNNPYAAAGQRNASLTTEKNWVNAYVNEAYLWYDQVPSVNPNAAPYSTSDVAGSLDEYFTALTSTPLDRFSFTYPTAAWNQLSQSGAEAGYGIEWNFASPTPPRKIRVAYVEAGSPAANAGVLRGDTLVTADGVSADDGTSTGADALNAALWPTSAGQGHTLVLSRNGSNATRSLTSAVITKNPVPHSSVITTGGTKVGYLVFNDHLATAEAPLIAAIESFRTQGVTELVLDLRYNGGGYLYLASELAYMIAGPSKTSGKVFEKLTYNAKRSAETNSANSTTPFYDTSCILSSSTGNCTNVQPLPTLNLSRVYVLTKGSTCSASESIMNGLRGVDIEVRQIGGTTCGKPYGFTAKDNCGISYFPIEFKGTNAKGFGDYPGGFVPASSGATGLPGCQVADDFSRPLGDVNEGMLAAALGHRANGSCPPVSSGTQQRQIQSAGAASVADIAPDAGILGRNPARENRLPGPR